MDASIDTLPTTVDLLSLPVVLKQIICSFLPYHDALALSATCSQLSNETVGSLHPGLVIPYTREEFLPPPAFLSHSFRLRRNEAGRVGQTFTIPHFFPRSCVPHTTVVRGKWRFNPYGFPPPGTAFKLCLGVVLENDSPPEIVIWESPNVAPESLEPFEISFLPKPNCTYKVWLQRTTPGDCGSFDCVDMEQIYVYSVVYDHKMRRSLLQRFVQLGWITPFIFRGYEGDGVEEVRDTDSETNETEVVDEGPEDNSCEGGGSAVEDNSEENDEAAGSGDDEDAGEDNSCEGGGGSVVEDNSEEYSTEESNEAVERHDDEDAGENNPRDGGDSAVEENSEDYSIVANDEAADSGDDEDAGVNNSCEGGGSAVEDSSEEYSSEENDEAADSGDDEDAGEDNSCEGGGGSAVEDNTEHNGSIEQQVNMDEDVNESEDVEAGLPATAAGAGGGTRIVQYDIQGRIVPDDTDSDEPDFPVGFMESSNLRSLHEYKNYVAPDEMWLDEAIFWVALRSFGDSENTDEIWEEIGEEVLSEIIRTEKCVNRGRVARRVLAEACQSLLDNVATEEDRSNTEFGKAWAAKGLRLDNETLEIAIEQLEEAKFVEFEVWGRCKYQQFNWNF